MKRWYERLRTRAVVLLHDVLMVPLAWLLAYWTRFNFEPIPTPLWTAAWRTLPWVMLICAGVYWRFGLYRGVWRFASVPDLTRILQATAAATAVTLAVLFAVNRLAEVPRSVPALFWMFQVLLLAGPRLLYRWAKDRRLGLHPGQRVLIVGAGRAGEMLVRDMLRDPHRTYLPVAFVDDRPRRQGSAIHGIPVRGGSDRLVELVQTLRIDAILLALPDASPARMRQLVAQCEQTGKPFRTVPRLHDLMSGAVGIAHLRAVSIEDLLGRPPVTLDSASIRAGLSGRCVLITGAGGSIGSELCRQVLTLGAARLVLVDHCELNLYRMEREMAERWPHVAARHILLDVAEYTALQALFHAERPQVVFHAAAYKHVPLLESQIRAAVRNNVFGTEAVARAALAAGCERFVLISTDKAVNPANAMGASKRVAELLCQALAQEAPTRFITVRFGNVLDSAGSVVPLFRRQIERGGPVTVTDPAVERYFMTIPEACQLILQAAAIGTGGEIFVLDMGEPVRIRELAEQMIRLAGREPGRDIAIEYIGLRPGEKRFEELFYGDEELCPTAHPRLRVARRAGTGPDAAFAAGLERLRAAVAAGDEPALRAALHHLVPQWQPPASTDF